ncbi:hypothetical protein Tco_0723952 [Tanacetum coccineum]
MPRRSTMEVIHIIRSLMEKYRERQKDLHLAFLDLEKAYDNVPRAEWKIGAVEEGSRRQRLMSQQRED